MTDRERTRVRPADASDAEVVFEHPAFFANGPVGWVEEIAVREHLRRRGLGSRLMSAFEDRVRERGGRLVALATTRASTFYESVGYDHHAAYYRTYL